ncbi:hypothetical protein ACFT5D_32275 [Streptomyces sp. NPDC057144]|uniref:hypothetical protein n=1 Tax=Streptomyces sp. NPDC057144 TaxID=3346034 RepID=UPI00362705EB
MPRAASSCRRFPDGLPSPSPTGTFAYEQAVHARQTVAIAAVLGDIRSEYDTWQAMNASGRYSDATPLSAAALGASTEPFLDHAWHPFLTVLDHAPTLLDRCRPANSP